MINLKAIVLLDETIVALTQARDEMKARHDETLADAASPKRGTLFIEDAVRAFFQGLIRK